MTGCVGSEDLDLTILSTHSGDSAMFKWTKEGNVEIVDNSDLSKVHRINLGTLWKEMEDLDFLTEEIALIVLNTMNNVKFVGFSSFNHLNHFLGGSLLVFSGT